MILVSHKPKTDHFQGICATSFVFVHLFGNKGVSLWSALWKGLDHRNLSEHFSDQWSASCTSHMSTRLGFLDLQVVSSMNRGDHFSRTSNCACGKTVWWIQVWHTSQRRGQKDYFCVSPFAFIQGRHQKGHWCWIILPLQAPESADQQFTVRYRSFLQSWLLWHQFQGLWFYKPVLLAEANSLVHLGWVCGKLFAGEIVSQHKVSIHLDAAFALSWLNIGLSGLCWNSDSMSTFQSSTNPPIPTQKPTITMTPPPSTPLPCIANLWGPS